MANPDNEEDDDDLQAEVSKGDVALAPGEAADSQSIVDKKVPADVRSLYDVYSYRGAAVLLSESHRSEFKQILDCLRSFRISTAMIRRAGGNESEIPKLLSATLRPLNWHETIIQGDLDVRLTWKEKVRETAGGKPVFEIRCRNIRRAKFLDGHKIDYVKGKVAFDMEWNSKDQTFDRDLYAFNAFALCGAIDVGVLVTRSASLNPVFRKLGQSLSKSGKPEFKPSGKPRMTFEKYGASTTWMGKLLYRLNAGRNGSCPVLVFGITPKCIEDWSDDALD
ncbi:MAG: restriction endonuclease [Alphaproteobacteria bacterium]|nr:restriction endonuclease [Alphaproteobacteria bacterium]